jgi:anti-anti-sigma factor
VFTSLLTGWFARPAECAALGDRPPIDAPALPARRAPRPLEAAVKVAVSQTADGKVIRVKGEALDECAGALLDGLLALAAGRPAVVTLDLSELRSISCLALGVLVAYCRSVVRSSGRVRLAGVLQPGVSESLGRAELFDLFETSAEAGPTPGLQAMKRPQASPGNPNAGPLRPGTPGRLKST